MGGLLDFLPWVFLAAGLCVVVSYWSDVVAFFSPPKKGSIAVSGSVARILKHHEQASAVVIRRGRGNTIGAEFNLMMAGGFLENMVAWRTVGIEGRLGGGKTLLSVALAKWLYERGLVRGVFANFPIEDKFIPVLNSCVNACVILDEGAAFADARDSARGFKGYGAYFRKLGSYLLSPSVYQVDRRMRPVQAERNIDLFMLGWWLYNWHDPRDQKGWFIFSGYETLFNKYDHRFIPADDGGILETLKAEIEMLSGSQRKLYKVGKQLRLENPYSDPLGRGL